MSPENAAWIARREALLSRLAALVVRSLRLRIDADEIDPDAALFGTGLRLDSIDSVELVVAVETEFNVVLVDREIADPTAIRTLNAIADRLVERGAA